MQITVVIPAYNGERYLASTIESVLNQTYTDWELVIVDDGSLDSTPRIIQEYIARDSRIRGIFQTIGNVAAARNAGIASASRNSDYIALLDHDDVWEPDALQTLLAVLEADPTAVAAYGLARYIDGEGNFCRLGEAEAWTRNRLGISENRLISWPEGMPTTFEVAVVVNPIHTPGQALIRRSALEQIGLLDPATVPSDDYDLWLRLTRCGHIVLVDRPLLRWRQHESNVSRQMTRMAQSEWYVRRKLCASGDLSEEQYRLAALGWQLWRRKLMILSLEWARDSLMRGQVFLAARQVGQAARNGLLALQCRYSGI